MNLQTWSLFEANFIWTLNKIRYEIVPIGILSQKKIYDFIDLLKLHVSCLGLSLFSPPPPQPNRNSLCSSTNCTFYMYTQNNCEFQNLCDDANVNTANLLDQLNMQFTRCIQTANSSFNCNWQPVFSSHFY